MSFKFLFTQNYNSYKLQQGLTQDEARVRGYNPLNEEEKATYWSPNDLLYGKNTTPSSSFVGPDVKDMEINALQHTVDHLDERIDPSNVAPEKKKLVKKQPFSFNLKGQTITFSDEDDPNNNTDFVYDHNLSARKNRKRLKKFLKSRGLGDKADATGFIAEYLQTQGLEGLSDKDSKWLNKRADQYEYTVDKNGNVDYHRKPSNWVQGLTTTAATMLGGSLAGMLGYLATTPKKRTNAISGFRTPTVEEEEEVAEDVTPPVTDPTKDGDPSVEEKPIPVKKYDPNKGISFTGFDPGWGQRAQNVYNDSKTAPVWAQMAGDDNEITKDEFIAWQTKNKVKGGYDGKLGYHTFNAMNLSPNLNSSKYTWMKQPGNTAGGGVTAGGGTAGNTGAGNTGGAGDRNTGGGNAGNGGGNTAGGGIPTDSTAVANDSIQVAIPTDSTRIANDSIQATVPTDLISVDDIENSDFNGYVSADGKVSRKELMEFMAELHPDLYEEANKRHGYENWLPIFDPDKKTWDQYIADNRSKSPRYQNVMREAKELGFELKDSANMDYVINNKQYNLNEFGDYHSNGNQYRHSLEKDSGYKTEELAREQFNKLIQDNPNFTDRMFLSDIYQAENGNFFPIVKYKGDGAYASDRSFLYDPFNRRFLPVNENMFGRAKGIWQSGSTSLTPYIFIDDLKLSKDEFLKKYGKEYNYTGMWNNDWFKNGGMIKKHATGSKMVSSQSDNATLEKVLLNATYALLGQASSQGKEVDIQSIIKNVADLYQNNQKELQKIISSNQQLIASVKNALKTNNPELYKQLEQPGTISQLIQEAIINNQNNQTKTTMAMNGTKLNYIKELKGICPEGYEIEYFATGGNVCSHCAKKKQIEEAKCGKKMKAEKHSEGGVSATVNNIQDDIKNKKNKQSTNVNTKSTAPKKAPMPTKHDAKKHDLLIKKFQKNPKSMSTAQMDSLTTYNRLDPREDGV